MALGDPYVTLALLKTYMGISGTGNDTELTAALNTASRAIERHCNRQFNDAGSASARVFRPEHARLCLVDDFSTTVGLVIATDTGDDGTYETTWTSSDYVLEPFNGVVNGESGWPFWRIRARNQLFPTYNYGASVQVTAQWGWTAVPAPVAQACKILAQDTYELKGAAFGIKGYGDYGMRVRDNPRVSALLAPYQRTPVLVA